MRLAEMWIRRKTLKGNIEQLKFRLTKVAKAQGGNMTPERPQSTIHRLLGAGRHRLEGGLRHVPAIPGSPHSQAPPIPQLGHAGNRTPQT
jgi:hypothetical protein